MPVRLPSPLSPARRALVRLALLALLGSGLLPCLGLLPGSLEGQQPDLARLDAIIAATQREWPVPGLSVAIVKDGRTVLARGYGVRRLGGREPVDEHTLFAIASNTKAFTSASLAMLVEAGAVAWDDRVRDHLPWFQLHDPYVSREMRVRDLLCHRSGLGTFSGDLLWYGTGYSARGVVERARHLEPVAPFRAAYGYQNLMFIAAGEVIAAAGGKSWGEFVRERILQPLGMDRTVVSVSELAGRENVATPHKNYKGEVLPIEWYSWDAMAAAGGIISSAADMARWLRLQLGRGEVDGRRLFSPESSQEMWTLHTPQAAPAAGWRSGTHFRGYGLGWALNDYRGRLVASHGGGYDGMYSQVTLVPEEGLGIVVLTNAMTPVGSVLAGTILDAYLGVPDQGRSARTLEAFRAERQEFEARQDRFFEGKVPGTRPSLAQEGYAGTYGGEMYGDATVTLENGTLVLRLLPNPDLVADLTHLHYDTFLVEWRRTFAWFGRGAATFLLDPMGKVTEMKLDVPNDDLWFYELELKRRER
jgi:CubicO group peptidase (beta-lactamase class C family)